MGYLDDETFRELHPGWFNGGITIHRPQERSTMKVRELIKKLLDLDPEATIFVKGVTDPKEVFDGEIINNGKSVVLVGTGVTE